MRAIFLRALVLAAVPRARLEFYDGTPCSAL